MDELIKTLVGSYPDLLDRGQSTPSSWIFISHDPAVVPEIRLKQICHAGAKGTESGVWDEFLTAVPNKTERSLRYILWLINNPFQQFKDHIELKSFGTKGGEGEFYLHITDLDKFPANAFYNFCIASRAPIEYPLVIDRWVEFMDLGVKPNLAFILASFHNSATPITSLDQVLDCVGVSNTNHWWFQLNSSWKLILANTPVTLTGPYKTNTYSCYPSDAIWGYQSAADTYSRFTHPVKKLMEMYPE